ncbi:MAG TPA: NAD-dependent epimerase/dehydratase family protein, partial [Casimicrobiaceae bacterium]|nr:NAD-dependent epimerase/dehydratase family protein [Casimicrobiaceae bacterium]
MKLLFLGGTRFLGRHCVDLALAHGHEVTLFTRGKTANPFGARVVALHGDRDPNNAPGLDALSARHWDAVIDTSGYVPRVVGASVATLASRASRYLFVSSISAYAKLDHPGADESAPLANLEAPDSEEILKHYGALKAACERVVEQAFGSRATIVRPGLIVGPCDASDRFGYWVARFVHPSLLGERSMHAVVPAPASQHIQFIDARDLAAFILDLVERDIGGTFNATSPAGQWTFSDLVHALTHGARSPPQPCWIDDRTLLDAGVEPWVGLPLWIPAGEPDHAGVNRIDCRKAQALGLASRPLEQTIADTAEWLLARDNTSAWKLTL